MKIFFISLLFLGSISNAATYYVSTSGIDENNNTGSSTKPFRTIARGSRQLAAGDTLYIRGGTYNEAMNPDLGKFVFKNGTSAQRTRYAAYPGETVTVKGPKGDFVVKFPKTTAYIELSGLIIDGTNVTSYAIKLDGSYSLNIWSHHIRILRNEIKYGRLGIGGGGRNEIIGNKIHHQKVYGIYTAGDGGLIEGNTFYDNGGYAIHHYQSEKTVNNWIIRGNIFLRNGYGFYHSSAPTELRKTPAVLISRGKNNRFYNNLVYDNHAGVSVGLGAVDTLVANNTVYSNDTYGIDVNAAHSGSLNARVINNIVWGNSKQITNNAINTTIKTNLTTDPKVVNLSARDFRLTLNSPAKDKGTKIIEVPNDFRKVVRPRGVAYDIGAYEY